METGYVYFAFVVIGAGDDAVSQYKIGHSKDPEARMHNLNTGRADNIHLEFFAPGSKSEEKALHSRYEKHHINREWFWGDGEIAELVEDLQDAQFILKNIRGGPPGEPTLAECLMFPDPGVFLNKLIAEDMAINGPMNQ